MFKEIPLSQRTEKRGSVRKLVFGIGVNDAPYQTTLRTDTTILMCPYFKRWTAMMARCYSSTLQKRFPSFVGNTVTSEWHSFMKFREWMITQNWQDKYLDKDLLSQGKKHYSPETCLFVYPHVNALFIEKPNRDNGLPTGVYLRKGKYEVGVSHGDSKRVWVGTYATVNEAIDAFLKAKDIAIERAINTCGDKKVVDAIKSYKKFYTDNIASLKTT